MSIKISSCLQTEFQEAQNAPIAPEDVNLYTDLTAEEISALSIRCYVRQDDGKVIASPKHQIKARGKDALDAYHNTEDYSCLKLNKLPPQYQHLARR